MIWGINATSGLFLSTVLWPRLWGEKRKQLLDVQNCNSESILTIIIILPVRPFLPTIHCVILPHSHWLQIKVLNSTSNLKRYTSSLSSSPSLLLHLTHNSINISLYVCLESHSHCSLLNLNVATSTFVPVWPPHLTSLLPWRRKGGQLPNKTERGAAITCPALQLLVQRGGAAERS